MKADKSLEVSVSCGPRRGQRIRGKYQASAARRAFQAPEQQSGSKEGRNRSESDVVVCPDKMN